jgi:hypothetical protein
MAPVNHNHLNKITWLKTVHTLMGKFCQESDDRNNMVPMEDMGRDACVMIGCHEQVSNLIAIYEFFQICKNTFEIRTNLKLQPHHEYAHSKQDKENLVSMICLNPVTDVVDSVKRILVAIITP